MSLLSLRDSDLIRAAIEIGVREAFAHCSPDILKSFAAAVGGEIPPPDQPLKLIRRPSAAPSTPSSSKSAIRT